MKRFFWRVFSWLATILIIIGFMRFYPFLFSKTISGEIVDVRYIAVGAKVSDATRWQMSAPHRSQGRAPANQNETTSDSAEADDQAATGLVPLDMQNTDSPVGSLPVEAMQAAEPDDEVPGEAKEGSVIKKVNGESLFSTIWQKLFGKKKDNQVNSGAGNEAPAAEAVQVPKKSGPGITERIFGTGREILKNPDPRKNLSEWDKTQRGHFLVAIRNDDGKIYTTNSLDTSWQIARVGMCAKARIFAYPPWNFELSGTYYGARLIHFYDCPTEGLVAPR